MTPTSTITIQDAIDTIVSATAVAPLSDTVDTVKTGDQHATGVDRCDEYQRI